MVVLIIGIDEMKVRLLQVARSVPNIVCPGPGEALQYSGFVYWLLPEALTFVKWDRNLHPEPFSLRNEKETTQKMGVTRKPGYDLQNHK